MRAMWRAMIVAQKRLGRVCGRAIVLRLRNYGQGCRPAVEPPALAEPLALPLAPPDMPDDEPDGELDDDAVPEPVVEPVAEPEGAAALFSFGCCVTRSRQCVAGDTLAPGALEDGGALDCAAATTMLPPMNADASTNVVRDRIWSLLGVLPRAAEITTATLRRKGFIFAPRRNFARRATGHH
jgi:hypothetical protein